MPKAVPFWLSVSIFWPWFCVLRIVNVCMIICTDVYWPNTCTNTVHEMHVLTRVNKKIWTDVLHLSSACTFVLCFCLLFTFAAIVVFQYWFWLCICHKVPVVHFLKRYHCCDDYCWPSWRYSHLCMFDLRKGLRTWEELWNVPLIVTEFDRPEVTLCGWQDVIIQSLINTCVVVL